MIHIKRLTKRDVADLAIYLSRVLALQAILLWGVVVSLVALLGMLERYAEKPEVVRNLLVLFMLAVPAALYFYWVAIRKLAPRRRDE